MAYLTLGEEFFKYNKPLFYEVLASLDDFKIVLMENRVNVIYFESDKFEEDEFCLALIKNDHKTKAPYFFGIIKGSRLNYHLSK